MQQAFDAGRYDHVQELAEAYEHLQRTHPLPMEARH
jgi:hypothetical protein